MYRPIKSSSGQPPQTNHTTVSRCDGEVVIHSQWSSSPDYSPAVIKILALLGAFYAMRYDAKGCYTFYGLTQNVLNTYGADRR